MANHEFRKTAKPRWHSIMSCLSWIYSALMPWSWTASD